MKKQLVLLLVLLLTVAFPLQLAAKKAKPAPTPPKPNPEELLAKHELENRQYQALFESWGKLQRGMTISEIGNILPKQIPGHDIAGTLYMASLFSQKGVAGDSKTELYALKFDSSGLLEEFNLRLGESGMVGLTIRAASDNDIPLLKAILTAKEDPNVADSRTAFTPLMAAVMKGKEAAVKELLTWKADPNKKNKGGSCALFLAVLANKNPSILKALIDANVDVNTKLPGENTALMMAVSKGSIENVRILIDAKADVNACATDGATSLSIASKLGHTEIVAMLTKAGAKQ
ncbi:MAG: ankyrin repeat domain-containing protein [Verrucomicrobia bacterium]|nr:ankyrin repeat domain-containing protein [Verrucomicrobiota bacterium]